MQTQRHVNVFVWRADDLKPGRHDASLSAAPSTHHGVLEQSVGGGSGVRVVERSTTYLYTCSSQRAGGQQTEVPAPPAVTYPDPVPCVKRSVSLAACEVTVEAFRYQ